MLAAIVFASLAFQSLGPVLPPSCSSTFQSLVLSIEDALQKEDFALAKDRLRLLPKTEISFEWDDSKVPQNYRDEYRKARDQAFGIWKQRVPKMVFVSGKKTDIKISFEPVLAVRPESGLPAGHVGFFSEDPGAPRLDYVIGLKRGRPLQASQVVDVFDDVACAVGMYFGIADGYATAYVMGPSDLLRVQRAAVSGTELTTLKLNMRAAKALQDAVENHVALIPAKSQLSIEKTTLEAPPSVQGDQVDFDMRVTNLGTGPLSFSMTPDCGCTVVTDPGEIAPQATRLLKMVVDTRLFKKDLEKHVILYTNDPSNPVKVVTLKIPIHPRFRFISPEGDTVLVPNTGKKFPLYLIPSSGEPLNPVSCKFDGLPGTVSMQRFHGMLADPESHEGPKLLAGYKFIIDLKGNLPPGRSFATLQILTSNSDFPDLVWTMNAQKGIIALPDEVSMGQVGHVPCTKSFLVSGPGTGFKVLGVTTNTPNLTATARALAGSSDFVVDVTYDGKGKPGELIADVRVKTSDPSQPIVHAAIRAMIQ